MTTNERAGWWPDPIHRDEFHYGNDGNVAFLDGKWFWQVGHVIPATRWDPADWDLDYEDAADSFTEACASVEWILAVRHEDDLAAADAQAEDYWESKRDAALADEQWRETW